MPTEGKPRKPRAFRLMGQTVGRLDDHVAMVWVCGWGMFLPNAKRLHAWLGRAIAWMEGER